MSEVQPVEAAPVEDAAPVAQSRQEAVDAAWAKSNEAAEEAAPTTEGEVTAETLEEKAERKSVAGSIREFIRAQAKPAAPEPTGLEREVQELRAALDSIAGRARPEPSKEELLLSKFEELQNQQAETLAAQREAEEQEAFEREVNGLRAAALENINAAKDNYPGLTALEQQDTVVNALFQRLEEGVETSEDEIASEVEDGLREVYQKLHAVYGSTPSEAPAAKSERQVTLSPGLSATDSEPDLSKMTREEKIEYLWNKSKS